MPNYQFTVAVEPQYLPEQSAPAHHVFGFSYTITVTNTGDATAQLIARHWVIQDSDGHTEEVRGLAVVGQQPLLRPGESFRYTSGCRLRTAAGTMHGTFFCIGEDATRFDTPVPVFVLDAQATPPPTAAPDAGSRVLH